MNAGSEYILSRDKNMVFSAHVNLKIIKEVYEIFLRSSSSQTQLRA